MVGQTRQRYTMRGMVIYGELLRISALTNRPSYVPEGLGLDEQAELRAE